MPSISIGSIHSASEAADPGLAAQACDPRAVKKIAGSDVLQLSDASGRRLGEIRFEALFGAEPLTHATQNEFKADLCRDTARLEQWALDHHWLIAPARSALKFRVVVSERFKISKSLVPAWSGHPGHMEFPTWRVVARKAAIAHELAHVFFPNGNRLLAEGLAVYLQAAIGGNPAFPNFGRPLHDQVRSQLCSMAPEISHGDSTSLDSIRFFELDAIATPRPLTLRVGNEFYGEDPHGQMHLYPIAGSFIQFLIERYGVDAFRQLYERSPLLPLQQNSGLPDRWSAIYSRTLDDLAQEWKTLIAIMDN